LVGSDSLSRSSSPQQFTFGGTLYDSNELVTFNFAAFASNCLTRSSC